MSPTQSASRSATSRAWVLPPRIQASFSPFSTLCSVYQGTQAPPLKLWGPAGSMIPFLKLRSVESSSGGSAPM